MAADEGANERRERDLAFAWFACGLMTGVALTLLLTPVRGREARRWVVEAGGATRRRTAAMLARNRQAIRVIRSRGILGLAHPRTAPQGEEQQQPQDVTLAASPSSS